MFQEVFSGNLESCILMGCCFLYQDDLDIRNKLMIIFKDFNLDLIPVNILVNFNPINEQRNKKYLYLSKDENGYKLLGVKVNEMFQTIFEKNMNIQSIFPPEINREIAKFAGFETVKNVSSYFKDIVGDVKFQKLSESKPNPIAIIIDKNIPIPSSVQYAILRDIDINIENTNIKYLATNEDSFPKNVEILIYNGENENPNIFSKLENLVELDSGFQISGDDYIFPKNLKKLTCSDGKLDNGNVKNFLKKLSELPNLTSLNLSGYSPEEVDFDLKYLPNLKELCFDGDLDINSINFQKVKLEKLVSKFNNPKYLNSLPISLVYLDVSMRDCEYNYSINLDYLVNLKTLILDSESVNKIISSKIEYFGVHGVHQEMKINFKVKNFIVRELLDDDIEIKIKFKHPEMLKSVNYLNKNTPDVENIIIDEKLFIQGKVNFSKYKNLKNIEVCHLLKDNIFSELIGDNEEKLKVFESCKFPEGVNITYKNIDPIKYMEKFLFI